MTLIRPNFRLFATDTPGTSLAPIIFIHGFPFNHTMWGNQAELCRIDRQVISYDARGHGQSDVGNGQYIFEDFVDDLFLLMDALQIPQSILCGLSMGGYVALRAIERQPERVLGLILCDTRSNADSTEVKLKRASDLRMIREQGLESFADAFLRKMLSPSNFQHQPSIVAKVRQMILTNPPLGVCGTLIALATRADTTPALSRIRVPTLILVGAEDQVTPPAVAKTLHDLIPSSEMCVIPSA
jgi:3-oxoadipate enol-lactonase